MDIIQQHINKTIAGSYEDFTALYHHFAPRLYSFIYNLTASKFITNDIVQETFIKIWEKREQIDENASFQSYIFTIARNQLLNEFRRQVRNPVFSDFMQTKMEEKGENSTIEQEMDFDTFKQLLEKAKKKLTPRQIEIFELNKEQGISIRDIAMQLNIKEQVVRNQLSAALHTLRNEMKNYSFLFFLLFIIN